MDEGIIGIKEIEEVLPHRYPFLLIDRVLELEGNKRIKAIKNVTISEPHFQGHFPGYPIMPGVLVIEALAQACGVLVKFTLNEEGEDRRKMFLVGINKARFKRQVVPGDTLVLEAEIMRIRRNMAQLSCKASVDGELACSAELLSALEL